MADDDRAGMIQVQLSKSEIEKRAQKLATEELEREKLLDKKMTHNREWNEQLKQSRTRIKVLSAEVDSGMAWVPAQEPMFGETSSSDDDTAEATPAGRRRRRRTSEPPTVDDAA